MNENKITIIFGAVAVLMLLLALILSPKKITPDAFLDQGEPFFPEFSDPNTATTLEVIDFDDASGTARPFKVTFTDGRWTIPSHHNYPADGKEHLAKTAAGVIDIKKDEFRTDNLSDHEACGVIDPLDETAGFKGRGQRITVKGENDKILADFIVGKPIEERTNFRYVRVPGQNRVYAVRMDIDISTRFEDWIETDLLDLTKSKIEKIILKNYSINERTYSLENKDNIILKLVDNQWTVGRLSKNQQVDSTVIDSLLNSLIELKIVGVRPKPKGITANLKKDIKQKKISQMDVLQLQKKGFYFSHDGQLYSNEGELEVYTTDGIKYILRFGEVVYGSGLSVTAGGADSPQTGKNESAENRYLFITSEFIPSYYKEPLLPKDKSFLKKDDSLWTDRDRKNKELVDNHSRWEKDVEKGASISEELNARFADWYYVISSDSYKKIHLKRADLIVKK